MDRKNYFKQYRQLKRQDPTLYQKDLERNKQAYADKAEDRKKAKDLMSDPDKIAARGKKAEIQARYRMKKREEKLRLK